MSEPKSFAREIEPVVPGVWRWHLLDDRIEFESDAYAVAEDDRTVLIDPLPLRLAALKELGPISAICLTAACHQRSAWRYRRRFGAKVYAPAGARGVDERPDFRYRMGDRLPGGLRAVHTPGPEVVHYAFLREGDCILDIATANPYIIGTESEFAMSVNLTDPIFNDENKAREHLEAVRWPDGPICPHCGSVENITRLEGESHRSGLFQCNACREHFTVMVKSVMERSHIPLTKWVLAFHLMAASKKGVSAHQLHRMLGITYKSAWFLAHRVREAMRDDKADPMGGGGKIVEADETFIGQKKGRKKMRGYGHKMAVVSLVERGGTLRSFHVERVNVETIKAILRSQADRKSRLMTDEAKYYRAIGTEFAKHEAVNHSAEEYVRGDVHTNTLEGYYSVFKRGMKGVYQHCGEKHLKRYVTEFDFRYNERAALGVTDSERAKKAIKGAEGRRLTYQQPVVGQVY